MRGTGMIGGIVGSMAAGTAKLSGVRTTLFLH
jgi:hypothetical protein